MEAFEAACVADASKVGALPKHVAAFKKCPTAEGMHALRRIFWHFVQKGHLKMKMKYRKKRQKTTDDAVTESKEEDESAAKKYQRWFISQFDAYVAACVDAMHDPDLCEPILHTLLSFVTRDVSQLADLEDGLFRTIVHAIIVHYSDALADEFFLKYVSVFDDVRSYLMCVLVEELSGEHTREILKILFRIKIPASPASHAYMFFIPTVAVSYEERLGEDEDNDEEKKNKKKRKAASSASASACSQVWRRSALRVQTKSLSDLWLSFLALPLDKDIYKVILANLHTTVLPLLKHPLRLADFLTDAYNVGGVTSLRALNGLFYLISKHNLDYPSFFDKLYRLCKPQIFFSSSRVQFFTLLDTFLSSTHLPGYIVAAFAKRFARMSLTAPPAAAVICCTLIYNILARHPSTNVLLHRPVVKGDDQVLSSSLNLLFLPSQQAKADLKAAKEAKAKGGAAGGARNWGEDPFLADEDDLLACRALDSSLWELKALENHYAPKVASLVSKIFTPTDYTLQQEWPIEQFARESYTHLFERELAYKKNSDVPMAYIKPQALFGTAADKQVFVGTFFPNKQQLEQQQQQQE